MRVSDFAKQLIIVSILFVVFIFAIYYHPLGKLYSSPRDKQYALGIVFVTMYVPVILVLGLELRSPRKE